MNPISAEAHAGKYESILLECCDAELKKRENKNTVKLLRADLNEKYFMKNYF